MDEMVGKQKKANTKGKEQNKLNTHNKESQAKQSLQTKKKTN